MASETDNWINKFEFYGLNSFIHLLLQEYGIDSNDNFMKSQL